MNLRASSGCWRMKAEVSEAEPRRHRVAQDVPGDHAGLQRAGGALHAADGAGGLQRVAGVGLAGRERGHVLADRQLGHRGAGGAAALEHGLGQRGVLDARAGQHLLALQVGDGLGRAARGHQHFVQHVLGVAGVGAEQLEGAGRGQLADGDVGRAGAVGAAVAAARQHGFHDLLGAGVALHLDVEAGVLEVTQLHSGIKRQAGGDGPVPDPDLWRLGTHQGGRRQGGQGGATGLQRAAAGNGGGAVGRGHGGYSLGQQKKRRKNAGPQAASERM